MSGQGQGTGTTARGTTGRRRGRGTIGRGRGTGTTGRVTTTARGTTGRGRGRGTVTGTTGPHIVGQIPVVPQEKIKRAYMERNKNSTQDVETLALTLLALGAKKYSVSNPQEASEAVQETIKLLKVPRYSRVRFNSDQTPGFIGYAGVNNDDVNVLDSNITLNHDISDVSFVLLKYGSLQNRLGIIIIDNIIKTIYLAYARKGQISDDKDTIHIKQNCISILSKIVYESKILSHNMYSNPTLQQIINYFSQNYKLSLIDLSDFCESPVSNDLKFYHYASVLWFTYLYANNFNNIVSSVKELSNTDANKRKELRQNDLKHKDFSTQMKDFWKYLTL